MKNSVLLRIRLPRVDAKKWLELPPTSRAKAVALVLRSAGKIDLNQLVGMRRELVNLATLLDQSLEATSFETVNENVLYECAALIKELIR